MAISETQKVDYLWKKLAYGLSKTDTNANKRATNESIASPLLLRGENVWAQSALVPGVIPGSSTSVVTVYPTSSPDETTADSSATTNRTWKTGLTDWIPPEYGSTYLVKVYIHTAGQPGSAASSGTQVFGAGSGNNDEWFFDYQSGILHFIGTNLPSGISGKSVYVSGARYTGIKGVAVPGAGATFTSLGITGISTFFNTTDNTLGDANTGAVQIDGGLGINKNVTIGGNLNVQGYAEFVGVATFKGGTINLGDADTDDINVGGEFVSDLVPDVDDTFSLGTASKQWKNLFINGHSELDNTVISGVSTFTSPLDINTDVDIDGHTELDNVNISGIITAFDLDVDGQTELDHLNVAGVSTYAGDADFNGHVDIDGHTELDNVNVSGIITAFELDVDGHTELDNVNVSGVTTTGGLLDINAGGQANTFKVEDLTDNRVVIAGTGGELEDDANLTFNGSTLSVGVDLDVDGHTELDNVNISGVTTVAGNIDANGDLDVDGHTNLDNLSVAGVTTFTGTLTASGSLNLSGDLDVDRHTNLDNVSVSGVSTFTGAIDANGDLDIDGHTNLDNVDIAGVTTTSGLLDINAGGQANTFKVEDLTDNRVVIAGTGGELEDDANLTFNGSTLAVGVNLDVTGDLDVDGHANLDNVSVAGVSTFTGAIDANGDLDVDGHTELDNVNISGVATATAFHTGAEGSAIRVTSNTISGPAEMFIDPAGVGDNTGALRIKGDLFVDGTQTVINSTTIELGDFIVGIATTATTDSLADGAGIKIGPDNTFLYDHSNTSLKSSENLNLASGKVYKIDGTDVLSATTLGSGVVNSSLTSLGTLLGLTVSGQTTLNTLGVTGVSTFTGNIDANGDLDVDGHTNLDNVSVSGVSTFTGNIDANGDLDVDGHTNLDNVSVAGVTTTSGLLDIDAGGRANTFIVEDLTNNRVVLAGTGGELEDDSNLTFNGSTLTVGVGLDVDGHTELDNVNISGVTTFTGGITASGSLNLSGDLDVDGHTNLDNVSVAGVSTFTGNIDANGDLDVDGHTNLDNVSVAGVTTFTGAIDANGDLDVDGHTELDNVAISGITTFSGYLDANANVGIAGDLDVDGHTNLDNVSISGVTTFTGAIDANGNLDVAGTLDVDGHTELDNVNISGVVTATSINATTFIGNGDFVDIDVDGHTELDHVNIAGIVTATTINATTINATTFAGNGDFVDIDVDGHTNLDNVSVAGVTTFAGKIVGAATNNVIPFLYSTMGDLPDAGTYHGAFAHVHNQGKGFFAHGGNWYELVNKELNGTVGTGTERYDIGYIDAIGSNITGVSTAATSQAATLNVGAGGTVLTASVNTSKVGINSTSPTTTLDVGGTINSNTDVTINGTSVLSTAQNDAVALAIALG